ncbi:hypothetical protein [Clostridium estertheticum]|uniref:hypothetical protein n=1 Tax=Clostridium estertheticum TaxID=238834 RepID=UPI001C0DB535|nr:hypothetical protein [Clostridium estertheticum]MBU3171343.1 hypothetical protein [Clostridium estertheticum]
MPLHNIPLYGFSYVGVKPSSSATFKYDTVENILKTKEKMLYKEAIIEIERVKENKHLYKEFTNIKKGNNKHLYKENPAIAKENTKHLYKEDSAITREIGKELTLQDREINKSKSKEIQEIKDIDIYIESNKNLLKAELLQVNKNNKFIRLSNELIQLNKSESIYTDLAVKKEIFKNGFVQGLELQKKIYIEKYVVNFLDRVYLEEITINKIKSIERHGNKGIDKNTYRFMDRDNLNKIDVVANPIIINRNIVTTIYVDKSIYHLNPVGIKEIDRNCKTILMYNSALKNIAKYRAKYGLYRIANKEIYKGNNKYFDRSGLNFIFKDNEKYLDREAITTMFKSSEKHLDREYIANMFNNNEKYLSSDPLTSIYKQIEKGLLNVRIIDIFKDCNKNLNTVEKEIFLPHNNKFIEVTKRWWWLSAISQADKLIIPNKDFKYTSGLLNNLDFEYLRFNNHPIEWGNSWGIDYNIPPYSVSVEIMLDLINIIAMVWHKNTQGWLNVTGKEGIQLLIELLYDWYTLDTSSPNTDYYRSYRWIRWEAEKVYFLDTQSGLQAIGILIANLIDYMKYHHFNLVPLWRNPNAMDIERTFNKVATNGDLMKDLDKNKGKRNYMIETQNFEKKNILGR